MCVRVIYIHTHQPLCVCVCVSGLSSVSVVYLESVCETCPAGGRARVWAWGFQDVRGEVGGVRVRLWWWWVTVAGLEHTRR